MLRFRTPTLVMLASATALLAPATAVLALQQATTASAATRTAVSRPAGASAGTLTIFEDGDTNVLDLYTKVLVPGFEKAYPGTSIKVVPGGNEDVTAYDQLAASEKAGKTDPYDILDGNVPAEAAPAHLLQPITAAEVPNLSDVARSAFEPVGDEAVPLRGSEVLLAYNSSMVETPPTTLSGLIAWIKANPGKFSYCNPNDGGSGYGFVQDVASSDLTAAQNTALGLGYVPADEKGWAKGLAVLKSIGPDIFDHNYPNSNTGVLTLLNTGEIAMGTVWSDMATAALKDGQLPKSVKLTSITPAMDGGPDYLGVPRNIPPAEKVLAYEFLNWALEPGTQMQIVDNIDGTPGIEFKYLPATLQAQFKSFTNDPALPYSDKSSSDLVAQWAATVG
ncbi:MAG TPA: extracellular solute-binding protein [Acidimicrobiales bacterium]|nr:extracellular solute-binding protein [Acidimicrobiales bacterium]